MSLEPVAAEQSKRADDEKQLMHPSRPGFHLGLEDNQIIVVVIPEENYLERLMSLISDLSETKGNICYVSLNRPYSSLISSFHKAGIDTSRIHFIDAITRTAQIPPPSSECDYVSSPGALTELSVNITRVMESGNYRYVVFDSLSTLLVYESDATIAKFVHFLMAKVRVVGCNAVFTCLKQHADSMLIKDINMFADKIIHMEKWRMGI
jgi:hypothetical protein